MIKYRNAKTGTIYDSVIFNGTGVAKVLHAGGWYTVKETRLEKIEGMTPHTDTPFSDDQIHKAVESSMGQQRELLRSVDTDELDKLVESWIPIEVKDAQYIKVAKIDARNEAKKAIQALILQGKIDELKFSQKSASDNITFSGWEEDMNMRIATLTAQLQVEKGKE